MIVMLFSANLKILWEQDNRQSSHLVTRAHQIVDKTRHFSLTISILPGLVGRRTTLVIENLLLR